MKKIILAAILLVFHFSGISQELLIRELNVSEIKTIFKNNEVNNNIGDGPYIMFNFEILNDTGKNLYLDTNSVNLTFKFNYEGKMYEEMVMWHFLDDEKEMILSPNSSKTFTAGSNIFIGTDLLMEGKNDYSLELIEVLPTIQLTYSDNTGLRLISRGIEKVRVSNYIAGDEN